MGCAKLTVGCESLAIGYVKLLMLPAIVKFTRLSGFHENSAGQLIVATASVLNLPLLKNYSQPESAAGEITICTDLEGEWVRVAIADNGPGIADAAKSQIFKHLFTTQAMGKGTGLGLAISRQIVVDKHQGRLTMNSTVGTGTEFLIELPV